MALELAGSGAHVVLCGRRLEPLDQVREEIEGLGREGLAVAADLREPDEVERVVSAALERFGVVEIVV
jgi:NADP-dependent 3-hydroxy acid dehydrogenase YdfG